MEWQLEPLKPYVWTHVYKLFVMSDSMEILEVIVTAPIVETNVESSVSEAKLYVYLQNIL